MTSAADAQYSLGCLMEWLSSSMVFRAAGQEKTNMSNKQTTTKTKKKDWKECLLHVVCNYVTHRPQSECGWMRLHQCR